MTEKMFLRSLITIAVATEKPSIFSQVVEKSLAFAAQLNQLSRKSNVPDQLLRHP